MLYFYSDGEASNILNSYLVENDMTRKDFQDFASLLAVIAFIIAFGKWTGTMF